MIYYAKSKSATGAQPTVKQHLDRVASLAEKYGEEFDLGVEARLAAQFHDFGKYSGRFQKVLTGECSKIDHAVCGAAYLYSCIADADTGRRYFPVMEAINGHHGELLEMSLLEPKLKDNMLNGKRIENADGKTSALAGLEEYRAAAAQLRCDYPEYRLPYLKARLSDTASHIESMLYTRMIFSCLVDADYSASAEDESPGYLAETEMSDFDPVKVLNSLYRYRDEICRDSKAGKKINLLRNRLFDCCGEAGNTAEGLFTLTAPTGTGKTLALLHFALRHCIAAGKRRIIVVLPFLTLTEQSAKTYRAIYSQLLEDHSQSELDDQAREFAARWCVPVIVTTSVRFFESLFADKPTDCRKLHHIANSVVLFDEAQSIPAELTSATLKAVNELCARYHTTMVFSTATQPDFSALRDATWMPREIMPDNAQLYAALRRTEVEWRCTEKKRTPLEDIAEEMSTQPSVCVVVNLRRHARKLFSLLKKRCPGDEIFYITTDLCPAHRQSVVEDVTGRLAKNLPCRLVATQCIEAGVDLDFAVMYRAMAPLEAIVQAAGRCNRNGRLRESGRVTVFIPDEPEPIYPGSRLRTGNSAQAGWYEKAAQRVEWLLHTHPIDIHNPEHLREYYQLLFRDSDDKQGLKEAIENRSFSDTRREYRLIESTGLRLIVPFAGRNEDSKSLPDYRAVREQALSVGLSRSLMKEAAPVTVSVSYGSARILEELAEPLYFPGRGGYEKLYSGYYVLCVQNEALYDKKIGLQLPEKADTGHFS